MNGQPAVPTGRLFLLGAAMLSMIIGAVVLYQFDPETAGFYPVCTFHRVTGLDCPGCGSLRALHQLAHGNIAGAWRFNPLLITVLPAVFWLMLREAARWTMGWRWPGIVTRPFFGWLLVIVTLAFGVARNLR